MPAIDAPCRTLDDVREICRQLMRANESNPDPNTGVVIAEAVTLALLARERFGIGQAVYVNMLTANLYANADDALDYAGKPARAVADDELHGHGARRPPPPHGRRLAVPGRSPATTSGGGPGRRSTVPSWPTTPASPPPTTGRPTTTRSTPSWPSCSGKRPAAEWEERFVAAGVAGVRADASTPGPFFAHHPQMLANDFAPECTHTRFGTHRRWGPIVRVDGGLGAYRLGRAGRRAHRRHPRRAGPRRRRDRRPAGRPHRGVEPVTVDL